MNCINHPETPVAAYCQNCGKPLCSACVRQVANVTYCEPCLAAKLGVPGSVNAGDPGNFQYSGSGPLPPGMPDAGPNPALATLLGFIPGVGAMYNGQFIKALVHVLVFVILVSITDEYTIFLMFVFAWVFYQVFDAHHTAKARREGMPLPDPFGLNELGVKLGIQSPRPVQSYPPGTYPPGTYSSGTYPAGTYSPGAPYPPVGAPFAAGAPFVSPEPGFAASATAYPPGASVPGSEGNPPYTAVPPVSTAAGFAPYPTDGSGLYEPGSPPAKRPEPVGAIILIALGVMFLLGTMGIFHFNWIGHSWPLILIGLGIWIFIRRSRDLPPGGGL